MAEGTPTSKISGWVKAGITSMVGLCSGAVIMYVSPLVNSAIKPGKPIANFGQQAQGLTVTFQNRSSGGGEGWWDFGDGSPLEPYSANQETVTHTYPRPGNYTARLSLRNFLGEENERAVAVTLDGSSTTGPVIEAFKVIPLKPDGNAPATFRVVSQIKNADLCIWSLGDDRPLDISNDTSPYQDRLVTIREPGYYTLRLVAVGGKQTAEKAESVFVGMGDSTKPGAMLQVTFEAIQVERATKEVNLNAAFPPERRDNSFPFSMTHVEPGYQIVDAKFKTAKDASVKNAKLTIAPDKSKVVLSGELVKPSGFIAGLQKNTPPIKWTPTVVLTLERRSGPMPKVSDPIVANLNLPGTTVLPLPKLSGGWEVQSSSIALELRDGANVVYRDSKLPNGNVVPFKNRPYRVVAIPGPDSLRLDVIESNGPLRPIGN